jgi:hypothetical protein
MQKQLLAACAAVAVAGVANAAPLAVESFTNLTDTVSPGQNIISPSPGFTLPGAPDIDAAGQFNSSYEYGPFVTRVTDAALKFPGATDNNFLVNTGAVDHFLRVYSNTAIADSAPNLNVAFAFNIASRSTTPADNDIDLWRFLDIGRTGGGSNLGAVVIRDEEIRLSTNGLGGATVGNISGLADNQWYVFVLNYNRAGGGAGSANSYIINATTGVKTDLNPLTGLTTGNLNPLATLATGATFAAPTGVAAFEVRLDTVAVFNSNLNAADLETEVRNAFALPSSVEDWFAF